MKTVLIVEDEKLIRQGIKTMIQRSGVPIEVIMECGNGEMALEIVKQQKIDVMFTDIRMPKMDGIELVRRIQQECESVPLIVAISGYDDFSYAVEMLRNGVREYILKPVEREKITGILRKFEEEFESRKKKSITDRQIGHQQIKYLLLKKDVPSGEMELLAEKYESQFFREGYIVCVFGKNQEIEENDAFIHLNDVGDGDVCIVEEKHQTMFFRNELSDACAGISRMHEGLKELREAYMEACEARKWAFCIQRDITSGSDEVGNVPRKLKEQAGKLLEEQARMQRLQLIGTDKTEELSNQWDRLFDEAKKERITPEEFFGEVRGFLDEVGKIYRNVITDEDSKILEQCGHFMNFTDISELEDDLVGWILELHNRINSQTDGNRNQQKIKMAVEYIDQNYNKDLNMAVVSNYISMNYSLFSFSFKQYTGSNFVNYLKDIRIREAKRLLKDTDMKVIEISQSVGYENEKHFMKIFKSSCGVSPSEYRKNMHIE